MPHRTVSRWSGNVRRMPVQMQPKERCAQLTLQDKHRRGSSARGSSSRKRGYTRKLVDDAVQRPRRQEALQQRFAASWTALSYRWIRPPIPILVIFALLVLRLAPRACHLFVFLAFASARPRVRVVSLLSVLCRIRRLLLAILRRIRRLLVVVPPWLRLRRELVLQTRRDLVERPQALLLRRLRLRLWLVVGVEVFGASEADEVRLLAHFNRVVEASLQHGQIR